MAGRVSRTKLARYVAGQLLDGDHKIVEQLAAYLLEEGRAREADVVARAISDELELRGHVLAKVTTAQPLDANTRQQIADLISTDSIEIDEIVDDSVLGGVRVETPSRVLDATLRSRLNRLTNLTPETV